MDSFRESVFNTTQEQLNEKEELEYDIAQLQREIALKESQVKNLKHITDGACETMGFEIKEGDLLMNEPVYLLVDKK